MYPSKHFDVHARGICDLAEHWNMPGDAARTAWKAEEIVTGLTEALVDAKQLYEDFRLGRIQDAVPFAYYVAQFRTIVAAGRHFLNTPPAYESANPVATTIAELKSLLADVQEIIDEDEFAQASHSQEDWN